MRLQIRLAIGLIFITPAAVFAQPGGDPSTILARVEAAYENLEYDEAEGLARSALSRFEAFNPDQLIRLHSTLALILYSKGEALEAAEQFRGALTLNPNLELHPQLVSPVTLAFFEETKAAFFRERESESNTPTQSVRYVQVYDQRPAATIRSAILPGWGQRFKGSSAKGWAVTGVWVTSLGGAAAAHIQRQNAYDAYLAETDPELVASRYDTYNTWHKVRGGLLLGAAAVWIYSAVDALASGGPPSSLQVSPTPTGISVGFRF